MNKDAAVDAEAERTHSPDDDSRTNERTTLARNAPSRQAGPLVPVLLAIIIGGAVIFAGVRFRIHGDHGAKASNATATITTSLSTSATPAPAPTTSHPPLPLSPPATIAPTTTPTTAGPTSLPWPTGAHDGSPAFFAYMGASLMFDAWTSCDTAFCIGGDGDHLHVYSLNPIVYRGQTSLSAKPSPYETLIASGFSQAEALALLKPSR
jgi:hypothetical protein